MKLITEVYDEASVLTEASEDGKKGYFIEGIFMQGDVKNRNGRIYPSAILENEMKRYNDQFIKTKRALGELGHPNGPQINGDRVSHLITEMKRDGSNFVGKAKILSTPMGEIVKTFIDEGVKVGVSTRGLGSVKPTKEGIMEVQDDFHLATVDIVTDPSGPNCFVNGIMENTEYYYDIASGNWRVMERLEETVKKLKKEVTTRNPLGEAKALRIFENFIASLK
jgi:sugar-specific transcriptional regulator TrmB